MRTRMPWSVVFFALLACALVPRTNAVLYSLTESGIVSNTLVALPGNLAPTIVGTNYTYDTGADSFSLDTYDLTANVGFSNATVHFTVNSFTNAGGNIHFGGVIGNRPNLVITATDSIFVNSVTTMTTTTSASTRSGGVSLIGPNGVTVTGGLNTRGSDGRAGGGAINITSSAGAVKVGGEISSYGAGAGYVTISGTSIQTANILNHRPTATAAGGQVRLTSTAGLIEVGNIDVYGADGKGVVILSAIGGGVQAGSIDGRASSAARSQAVGGGTNIITASAGVTVGSINVGSDRASVNANVDVGGLIAIQAGDHVTVSGSLNTYVSTVNTNSSGRRSFGGDIAITSTNGNISVAGAIDASSPAGTYNSTNYNGKLTLRAAQGSITLAELDVDKVSSIELTASMSLGTTIVGELLGLDSDIGDSIIDRFTAVTGNVYYDSAIGANAYLGGNTYAIANSVGGTFYLTVIPEPTSLLLMGMGVLALLTARRKTRS